MIHELKILPEYFEEVETNHKIFEIRENDRDFQVGDTLTLNEWDKEYTGNSVKRLITYILSDNKYVKDGYVIMSIVEVEGEVNGDV